jgi:hypothetical protein
MPMYLGKAVSDEYMQGLIEGYRDGQRLVPTAVEDGDQPIINRLTEEKIVLERKAVVLGYQDGQGKGVEE